jgi:hypothetical protein
MVRYSRGVNQTNAVGALAGLRMVIGMASWTTPRLAGRLFGLDAGETVSATALSAVALGVLALGDE